MLRTCSIAPSPDRRFAGHARYERDLAVWLEEIGRRLGLTRERVRQMFYGELVPFKTARTPGASLVRTKEMWIR